VSESSNQVLILGSDTEEEITHLSIRYSEASTSSLIVHKLTLDTENCEGEPINGPIADGRSTPYYQIFCEPHG